MNLLYKDRFICRNALRKVRATRSHNFMNFYCLIKNRTFCNSNPSFFSIIQSQKHKKKEKEGRSQSQTSMMTSAKRCDSSDTFVSQKTPTWCFGARVGGSLWADVDDDDDDALWCIGRQKTFLMLEVVLCLTSILWWFMSNFDGWFWLKLDFFYLRSCFVISIKV